MKAPNPKFHRAGERLGTRFGGHSVRAPSIQADPAGEQLFKYVDSFFGKMTEVRQQLRGAAQIRVGASPIVFRDYLPPVLDAIRRKCPDLNMVLRALNQPELIDAIKLDELDIVISLIPDKLNPALSAIEIVRLPLVLLLPKSSKIKSAKDLCPGQKMVDPLISLKPNELICQIFQQRLGELGISWLPKIEMDSLDLIEKYVETDRNLLWRKRFLSFRRR